MTSRVISALNGVTLIITLRITNLLSPLPLQGRSLFFRGVEASGFRAGGLRVHRV